MSGSSIRTNVHTPSLPPLDSRPGTPESFHSALTTQNHPLAPAAARPSTGRGASLAKHPRTTAAQVKLNEFRHSLNEVDRQRFDGVRDTVDKSYDRWRMKVDPADLPAFDDEVAVRAMDLTGHDYSADKLEKLEQKATRLDVWADRVVGGAKSTPFAIASVLTDLLPAMSGGERVTDLGTKMYMVGAISAIIDTAGGEALNRAVHDAWWLRINPADQTPTLQYNPKTESVDVTRHPGELSAVMQKAVENIDSDIGVPKKMGQAALSFQSYTVRNLARIAISPIASLFASAKAVSHIDTGVASLGGIASGAFAYQGLGHFAHANGLSEFSALLGRRDYLQRLEQLDKTSLTAQTKGALVRTSKIPIDLLTDGTTALQSVFRPENLVAGFGPLAGGIAAIGVAKTKAAAYAAAHNFSPAGALALAQTVGMGTMMPVLAAWPATGILVNHYKKPAAEIVHQRFHQTTSGPEVAGSGVAGFGAEIVSGAAPYEQMPRTGIDEQRSGMTERTSLGEQTLRARLDV